MPLPVFDLMVPKVGDLNALLRDPSAWIFELKYDGIRCLFYLEAGKLTLYSKKRKSMAGFHSLKRRLERLKVNSLILDGEIVCLDENGCPDFYGLIRRKEPQYYYAFDILWLNGHDLRGLPLIERKSLLKQLLSKNAAALYADYIEAEDARTLYQVLQQINLEGLVAKPKMSIYRSVLSPGWVKLKNPKYWKPKVSIKS
jgi:bifunctional non-homologous end joining protein LigD